MNIVIRVDSSKNIGAGHLMRCLNLAQYLIEQETIQRIDFICKDYISSMIHKIKEKNIHFGIHKLKTNQFTEPTKSIDSWLGSWEDDAEQCITFLNDINIVYDILIIDHYNIDKKWELILQPHVKKIIVIDDLHDRPHHCNLLLDQICQSNPLIKYLPLVCSPFPKLLTGSKYAILDDKILAIKPFLRKNVENVLISFGGYSDNCYHDLIRVLNILTNLSTFTKDTTFHIVLGFSQKIEELTIYLDNNNMSNFKVYGFVDFSTLLDKIDLSIGAIGTSTFERSYLGIPTIGITVADNQKEFATEMHNLGIVKYVGHIESWNKDEFTNILLPYFEKQNKILSNHSQKCLDFIDGKGKERILTEVLRL